jgi:ubiquinone/menaquinone biosynthesis C-methylase UbiE
MEKIQSLAQILPAYACFPGRTVVDVGCGTGDLARWLAGQGARVIGLDTPAMLARAAAAPRGGAERYLAGAGEAMPLAAAIADLVVFAASLHHVPPPDMAAAVRECARVLKPGARAVFIEPVKRAGAYTDITHLYEDETTVLQRAAAALRAAARAGFRRVADTLFYLERSFQDYEQLMGVFVPDEERRRDILGRARAVTAARAAADGVALDLFRYRSIVRVTVLEKTGPP